MNGQTRGLKDWHDDLCELFSRTAVIVFDQQLSSLHAWLFLMFMPFAFFLIINFIKHVSRTLPECQTALVG